MTTKLQDRGAIVAAMFGHGYRAVQPFDITWREMTYTINKMSYGHRYQEGNIIYHVFSATDGHNYFELKYHPEELKWLLERVN